MALAGGSGCGDSMFYSVRASSEPSSPGTAHHRTVAVSCGATDAATGTATDDALAASGTGSVGAPMGPVSAPSPTTASERLGPAAAVAVLAQQQQPPPPLQSQLHAREPWVVVPCPPVQTGAQPTPGDEPA